MSEKRKMTTIKVSAETAAVIANTVRSIRAKGDRTMTADKLLLRLMFAEYPEQVRIIYGDRPPIDDEAQNEG